MKSALHVCLAFVVVIASLSACTGILGGFDYQGTGGAGGTGGAMTCSPCAQASNCSVSSDCATPACVGGCCAANPLPFDTKCGAAGDKHCDGKGACVACNVSAECTAPTTKCQTATCTAGACGTSNAPAGTTCSDSGGMVCDGNGACVACQQTADCGTAKTLCATPTCMSGTCTPVNAKAETKCADNGGSVCDGSGKCVACVMAADCPATGTVCAVPACASSACMNTYPAKGTACTDNSGTVCDGMGKCVSAHCTDGVLDGDETDIDCGGSCAPCVDGKTCKMLGDCASGYCVGTPTGTCTACTKDLQCASGSFCDPNNAGGTCTKTLPNAKACSGADQCASAFCADGVCCDAACTGTCMGCTMAHTGMADGTCNPYSPGTAAPAGQCATSGTAPCGNDGRCGSNGACQQAPNGTACGTTCLNGTETNNICNGSGACVAGTSMACPGNLECSGNGCLSSCSSDPGCAPGYWCTGGACVAKGAPGATCSGANQCALGNCVDGYCCNTACNTACQACAAALTGGANGTCAPANNGIPDPRMLCLTTTKVSCGMDGTCSGGACHDWASGTDCTTVCSGGIQNTASCNGTGACASGGTQKACAPYLCGANGCKTICASHADCVNGDFCWQSACVAPSKITAGPSSFHTCVLNSAGGVQCWGYGNTGQLGNGSMNSTDVPVPVMGLTSGVSAVVAGDHHTCALISGGVQCWGDNTYGQLGVNPTTTPGSTVPIAVPGLTSGIAAIGLGGYHTCAVTTAGALLCLGSNGQGQLGNNSTTNSFTPVAVLSGIAAVVGGENHTCALTTAGGVQCWGANQQGELGNGTFTSSLVPVAVTGLAGNIVTAIAAGETHTCALEQSSSVQCWGANSFGQLGNNSTTASSSPTGLAGISGISAIAAGSYHTCAVITGGAIDCWGWNANGQLGTGNTTNSLVPVAVTGLSSGNKAIAAGQQHTCALTPTGPQCWGDNSLGELGNNTMTNSLVPVPVAMP